MKLNRTLRFRFTSLIHSLLIMASVLIASGLILFSFGLSQLKSEAIGYLTAHKRALSQALIDGNIIELQNILVRLERFGVESSTLKTDLLQNKKPHLIYSGKLRQNWYSQKSTLQIIDNGLKVGTFEFTLNPIQVFSLVLERHLFALALIAMSNLAIALLFNFIFLTEVSAVHRSFHNSIKGMTAPNKMEKPSFLRSLIVPNYLKTAIEQLIVEVRTFRNKEVRLASIETMEKVARQVAHDIRSPLSALKLISGNLNGSVDAMRLMQASIDRLSGIADDLLETPKKSGLESDFQKSNERLNSTALKNCILDITNEFRLRYPMIAFEVQDSITTNISSIEINKYTLSRVLSILLENSVQASQSDHSIISIKISNTKFMFEFSVTDYGCGIPAHILNKIGNAGFTYGKTNGNGMGLSYIKQNMEELKGNFNIKSIPTKGTIVEFALPFSSNHYFSKQI